jgi:predicted metal-dependent enzyme (double-stranded beta helix superfamily)
LVPGQVEAVSPKVGDIHQVSNAHSDQVSISIHVYGANIGAVRRAVYQPDGSEKPFISGYSNDFSRISGICPKKRALPYEHRVDP